MNKFLQVFPVIILSVWFASCGSPRKIQENYNFMQAAPDSAITKQVKEQEPVIQKNDLLSIVVYSASTKPEADLIFNPPAAMSNGASSTSNTGGYLVDARGNIEFPRIGTVKAEGFTKSQLADDLKKKIEATNQLINPTVVIRFLSYRITVLGEVGQQGVFTVPSEKVTILEAIGLAGGITTDGRKTTVKVMREVNGVRETGTIDLTGKDMFESPYYYLRQNDVVMVDMTKRKSRMADQQSTLQKASFFVGIVTAFVLIYNTFK